ncbi:MAG: hypothetical protein H7Z10_01185, partial [Gemmatimonadaceae bacterium]|nr:hypothetical protein [Acetobacteraceae bacterium]
GLRRRLLALALLPVLATGTLAVANSVVAIPSLRGQVFVNRMADLYTLGVVLPALRHEDFERAGLPLTAAEFATLDLGDYRGREAHMWGEGPQYLRSLMQQKLGITEVYDRRFQDVCAAIVRSALLHHPHTLAIAYVRGLLLYFDPREWRSGFEGEMGYGRPLPDWSAAFLAQLTGRPVAPDITGQPSVLPSSLGVVIGAYPILLIMGAGLAVGVLAGRPFGPRHLAAAAVISTLLLAPLFSHLVKPRYVLATITLSEVLLVLTLADASARATMARAGGRFLSFLWRTCRTPALPAAAAMLCVAAYAGQLGLGRWQSDELTLFANQRDWGWAVLLTRLIYAPRPFSEGILFLYGEAVLALGRPLIVPFLAVLWAGAYGAAVLAARGAMGRTDAALALVTALFAFVLATNDVTEMFYWPMAAAAYLPTAAAATVLLFLLSRPLDRGRRAWCGVALLVAACSSEMGAALAIGFAGAVLVSARPWAGGLAAFRDGIWWLLPGLAGTAVLAVIWLLRADIVELGADTQPYTGQFITAIGLAFLQLPRDLLGGAGAATPGAMLGAVAAKLLFALGFGLVWRQADPVGATPGRWDAVLAAALVASALFSVAAAYYHYGFLCCERQATTRFWLMDLLAIIAMAWVVARWRVERPRWLAPAILTIALFPVLLRSGGLYTGYDNQRLATEAVARTWRSGQGSGGSMEFYLPPDNDALLVRGTSQPIGAFQAGAPDVPVMVTEVARFFGKSVVVTCHPWQNEKSWLIRGQFIPACPPHGGPPDEVIP